MRESALPTDVLSDILRCPRHTVARLEAESGGFRCGVCGRLYPLAEGVPDMVGPAEGADETLGAEAQQWDEQAERYEEARVHDPGYTATVDAAIEALSARPGELVLDAGCGTGLAARRLAAAGVRVVGLDLSLRSLLRLRRVADPPAAGLVRGDLAALPFAEATFDRVLSANALQHVPGEQRQRQCLAELARVARPGARVVITAHNYSIPKRRAGWPKEGQAGGHSGGVRFIHRFDADELRGLLPPGLAAERVRGAGLPLPYRWKLSPISRRLERLLRRTPMSVAWGNLLVVTARKRAG